jgi:hypothetical protein
MERIQIQTESPFQHLLRNFSDMSLNEIESFIGELNALAARKRAADVQKRDKFLLRKINEAVLPEPKLQRYIFLQEKMEVETISEIEYAELLSLVTEEEKIRNKRFQFLLELSQLRDVTLLDLMMQLGLNMPNYA